MAAIDDASLPPLWAEWGRMTRFLESARLAFARERNLWTSLELASADALFASVLIHSYAFAESAAAARLGKNSREFDGIEDWGAQLLAANGTTWDALKDGCAGVVEVAVVRNAYAHGARCLDRAAAKRLRHAGRAEARAGDPVTLDYATLRVFRGRLRSLLSLAGMS